MTGRPHSALRWSSHLCSSVLHLQEHISTGYPQRSLPRVVKAWEAQLMENCWRAEVCYIKHGILGNTLFPWKKSEGLVFRKKIVLTHLKEELRPRIGTNIPSAHILLNIDLLSSPLSLWHLLFVLHRISHPLASLLFSNPLSLFTDHRGLDWLP